MTSSTRTLGPAHKLERPPHMPPPCALFIGSLLTISHMTVADRPQAGSGSIIVTKMETTEWKSSPTELTAGFRRLSAASLPAEKTETFHDLRDPEGDQPGRWCDGQG